eukprot:1144977-Pelagomonas_calceolata.AAC.6
MDIGGELGFTPRLIRHVFCNMHGCYSKEASLKLPVMGHAGKKRKEALTDIRTCACAFVPSGIFGCCFFCLLPKRKEWKKALTDMHELTIFPPQGHWTAVASACCHRHGVFSSRLEKYLVEMYLKEKALFWGAAAAEQLVAQQSANAGASNTGMDA